MSTETIYANKYTFVVNENILEYDNNIISHSFRIGGDYDDCVNICYIYKDNKPVSAKIAFVQYDPECSLGVSLEKGGGTAIMLKAFLKYVHQKIPSITLFTLDDMSNIDCSNSSYKRAPIEPINLAYLSIVYNSCTWYEKHFDAKMIDAEQYYKYKNALSFLTDPSQKLDYASFFTNSYIPFEQFPILQSWYESSTTYRDFFNKIPFHERCKLLNSWLNEFVNYYLKKVYSSNDWVIDVNSTNIDYSVLALHKGGTKTKKRRTLRKSRNPEPRYKIISYQKMHCIR